MAPSRQPFEIRRFPRDVIMVQEADHRETVAFYLVPGDRDVAVIDTGLGGDLLALVERLSTERPVVLQTHLHWDHIGGNHEFSDVRAHTAELDLRRVGWPWEPPGEDETDGNLAGELSNAESRTCALNAVMWCSGSLHHGDQIDLGRRSLEVIHTPGHSPGSLSFLDREARVLFCGDLCYFGQMLLFVDASDVTAFRDSLHVLASYATEVDAIFPAHGPAPMTGEDVVSIREAFELVWRGKSPDRRGSYSGHRVAIHDFGQFAFLMPPD